MNRLEQQAFANRLSARLGANVPGYVASAWDRTMGRPAPPTMPRPGDVRTVRLGDGVSDAHLVRAYRDARHVERRERAALMVADGWMIPGVAA